MSKLCFHVNRMKDDMDEGVGISALFAPEDRKRLSENFKQVMSGESFEDHEYTGLRKDGATISILVYSSLIIKDGRTTGVRGITLDITERKQAEEEPGQAK